MQGDAAMRARVDGKTAVEASKAWELHVGELAARCLKTDDGYIVQGRTAKGWTAEIGRGSDPLDLLRSVVASKGVAKLLRV
jgi:hypothetical protein